MIWAASPKPNACTHRMAERFTALRADFNQTIWRATPASIQKNAPLLFTKSVQKINGFTLNNFLKTVSAWASVFEEDEVDSKTHVHGKYSYANGDVYEGGFFNGKMHGWGKYSYASGDVYEGIRIDGKMHGKGKYSYASGDVYEGDWADDKMHGQGTYSYANGNVCKGDWVDNWMDGEGEYTSVDGFFKGRFIKSHFQSNSSHLEDILFLNLITGRNKKAMILDYCLGIIFDYLLSKPAYREFGESLRAASVIHQMNGSLPLAANLVLATVKQFKTPQLLLIHSKNHCLGLQIIPDLSGRFVFLDIFNSGEGLERWHQQHPIHPKYQTQLRVTIPIEGLTPNRIEQWIKPFENVDEFYQAIFSIPGAVKILPEPKSAIWQTKQKKANCTLEWIFAFLRNRMAKKQYDRMRIELFQDCIARIRTSGQSGPEIEEIVSILQKKIEKRIKREYSSLR